MNKKLEQLNTEDFLMVYQIMEQSFPPCERRTYEKELELLKNPNYHVFVMKKDNMDIVGFLATWELETFRFVEHFAIQQAARGLGIGSEMMKEYLSYENKPVFIEVEEPDTMMSKRRIDFYKRLGFVYNGFGYLQPCLQDNTTEVSLKIMSYPAGITQSEFNHFRDEVFSKVYGIAI
ncbi:GNAT family N-acetyltransferase [Oscillospiraceae bacterium PP1C4]